VSSVAISLVFFVWLVFYFGLFAWLDVTLSHVVVSILPPPESVLFSSLVCFPAMSLSTHSLPVPRSCSRFYVLPDPDAASAPVWLVLPARPPLTLRVRLDTNCDNGWILSVIC
jgi:hypothetical protein